MSKERLLLLYDGKCALCLKSVETLRRLKPKDDWDAIPFQAADLDSLLPGVSAADLQAQLHVIEADGRVYRGAEAIIRIMRTVPWMKPIAWLYAVPGCKPLADAAYRWIARHRYALFGTTDACESGACRLPDRTDARDR